MQRFFEIPELLNLTFRFLNKQDHCTLLCVSRRTFYSAAPFVWKYLRGVSDLMMLIRGARFVVLAPGRTQCIDLPPSLDKSDFSRFDLYARFVSQVVTCHDPERYYLGARARRVLPARVDSILNWQSLLDYASDKVLLPNLTEINCFDPDYQSSLNWLSALLSPSVRRVGFVNEARWPLGSHSHLLTKIKTKSPDLNKLELYRGWLNAHRIKEDPLWDLAPMYSELFIEKFATFPNLRSLTGNEVLLYPSALQVLGSLPSLRELFVHIDDAPPLEYNNTMSNDLFPSLRRVFITGISASWVTSLWHIKPFVKRLENIHLCIGLQDQAEPELDGRWPDDFLLQLCNSSPQISDIFAVFSDSDICEEEVTVSASPHVLEALGQLPLKSFWLDNINFGGCAPWKILSSAWPNLTTLYCGQQSANLADLVDFARNLPRLGILVLDLDMETSGIPDYSAPPFIPVPRHTAFRCLARNPPKPYNRTRSQTMKLAKYLHYLWPNIRCALSFYDLTEIKPGYHGSGPEEEGQMELNRLDACIHKLRLKSLISQ